MPEDIDAAEFRRKKENELRKPFADRLLELLWENGGAGFEALFARYVDACIAEEEPFVAGPNSGGGEESPGYIAAKAGYEAKDKALCGPLVNFLVGSEPQATPLT